MIKVVIEFHSTLGISLISLLFSKLHSPEIQVKPMSRKSSILKKASLVDFDRSSEGVRSTDIDSEKPAKKSSE